MRKSHKKNEKIEAMEAERQRRIDALPDVQVWEPDQDGEMWESPAGGYVKYSDYEAATDWLRAENARLRMGDTWPEQRRGYEAEIMRLQAHLERGRGLIHRVTSTIGQKQDERDLANERLKALNAMLIAHLADGGEIRVSTEAIRAVDGKLVLDIRIEDGFVIVGTKEATPDGENTDGATPTDAGAPVVPAPAEEDSAEHPDHGVQSEQDADLPADL